MAGPLGRVVPPDFEHVDKYPLRALSVATPSSVERVLKLPGWHKTHDQVQQGSCVGHGSAMERAIENTAQNFLAKLVKPSRRYDPISLWDAAKLVDGDPDTNPGDNNGTFVRSAYDVLRDQGARRVHAMKVEGDRPVPVGLRDWDLTEGVEANRWATTVDEIRLAIDAGQAVTIGVNWYAGFDTPVAAPAAASAFRFNEWVISATGPIRGGHCVCLYGASDRRQAFKLKNSWGPDYPLVWISYRDVERLLNEDGEAAIVTDR